MDNTKNLIAAEAAHYWKNLQNEDKIEGILEELKLTIASDLLEKYPLEKFIVKYRFEKASKENLGYKFATFISIGSELFFKDGMLMDYRKMQEITAYLNKYRLGYFDQSNEYREKCYVYCNTQGKVTGKCHYLLFTGI
jgi:hypothetical protein